MTVHDDLATLRKISGLFPEIDRVEAEIARLRDETAESKSGLVTRLMQRAEAAEAEIARLEQDNAVLRELPSRETVRRAEAAEAEVARLRDGLRRIAENAEAWHGPEGLETGHARALGVIGSQARALLADQDGAFDARTSIRERTGQEWGPDHPSYDEMGQ